MLQRPRRIKLAKNCQFCNEKKEPFYGDVAVLSKYMTDRGRIISKDRTALCSKHQKRLSQAVKRARHLAMLPFVSGL